MNDKQVTAVSKCNSAPLAASKTGVNCTLEQPQQWVKPHQWMMTDGRALGRAAAAFSHSHGVINPVPRVLISIPPGSFLIFQSVKILCSEKI